MAERLNLLKEARSTRDMASRALKRALQLSDVQDRSRLRKQAEHLQEQARALEARAASLQDVPIF